MLILGKHLNENKTLCVSLQTIIGVNTQAALKICSLIGVCPRVKLRKLPRNKLDTLLKACREEVDNQLRRTMQNNIQFYTQMKHYKGFRHMSGLPVRGQRTRTNAQTAKRKN
jgi:small subunit ribosomal protein S13